MGITLNAASEMTGVSKTMLSQIERGESVPTLAVVWKIANGLKVRLATLTEDKDNLHNIHNIKDLTPLYSEGNDALIYNILPFATENGFEVFLCNFAVGCDYLSSGHTNGKFEYCFVVEGEIDIFADGGCYHLSEGDFVMFNPQNEHRYVNNGKEDSRVHCIVCYN